VREMRRIFKRYDKTDPFVMRVIKRALPWTLMLIGFGLLFGNPMYMFFPSMRYIRTSLSPAMHELSLYFCIAIIIFAISATYEKG